ncbi:hypothetical protein LCGC14_2216980 [marine sediment metagenome]|uniref:Uncharacterized protein n=1 Tax=marine sediment metagenome TaxID=412755 RepID=A0A0F9DZN7_9ZZZZ
MDTNFIKENWPIDVSPSSQAWLNEKLLLALDEYDKLQQENEHLLSVVESTRQDYADLLDGSTEARLQAEIKLIREQTNCYTESGGILCVELQDKLNKVKEYSEQALKGESDG